MSEQKIYHEFTKKIYDQQVMLRNGFKTDDQSNGIHDFGNECTDECIS